MQYGFSQSVQVYSEITGGTVLGHQYSDDNVFVNPSEPYGTVVYTSGPGFPIGFDFIYNEQNYTKIGINPNGWVSFGVNSVNMASSSPYYPMSANSTASNALLKPRLAIFGHDIKATAASELRIQTIGGAPNRKCVVQWKNFTINGEQNLNFQIRLHETSNMIEFIYGEMALNPTGAVSAEIGLRGALSNQYFTRANPSGWSTTTTGVSNNIRCMLSNASLPQPGCTFKWTPPVDCNISGSLAGDPSALTEHVCVGSLPAKITTGNIGVTGIAYQWQESSDGGITDPWSSTGTTTLTFSPPYFTSKIYYRLQATCVGSGAVDYSDPVLIDNSTPPTAGVSNLLPNDIGTNTMRLDWINGNGNGRFVVMNTTNNFTDPVNGIPTPAASTSYAGGEQIIYNGDGSTISISGLNCNTPYYFKAYEYETCASSVLYNEAATTNSAVATTFNPIDQALPITNDFAGFSIYNLGTLFPGWRKSRIAGSQVMPNGTTSSWKGSYATNTSARMKFFTGAFNATLNEWIISPSMQISAPTTLSFNAAITNVDGESIYPTGMQGTDDYVRVMISTDECGAVWTPIYTLKESTTADLSNTFKTYTINLDAYMGESIQIAFQGTRIVPNQASYDFHIDDINIFETPACQYPINLVTMGNSITAATVSWSTQAAAPQGYEYVFSTTDNVPAGTGIYTPSTSAFISGLTTDETYYLFVRSVCGSGSYSTWSGPEIFQLSYCNPSPSIADGEGIIHVSCGTIENHTGEEIGNYGNFAFMSTNAALNEVISATITLATDDQDYDVKIWVDWNNDLDFDDLGEEVFHDTTLVADTSVLYASFTVPETTSLGIHRMRIGGQDYGPTIPCYDYIWGAFEDYSLNIVCPNQISTVVSQDEYICGNTSASFSATGIPAAAIRWFDVPVGGNLLQSGPAFSSPLLSSSTSYWVEQLFPACGVASDRIEVNAIITPVELTLSPINNTCHGQSQGSFAVASITCGSAPFSFAVDGGAFGPLPTDLNAGTHIIVAKDALQNTSHPIEILITEPDALIAPTISGTTACAGSQSEVVIAQTSVYLPLVTTTLTFNLPSQPTEGNANPGTILSTTAMPTLPTGALVSSATLSVPGTISALGSSASEIKFGLTGAVTSVATAGSNAPFTSGAYDYIRTLPPTAVNSNGGNVSLLYWNAVDDVVGNDAILGSTATLTIEYQLPDPASLTWWTAATGGTQLGSTSSLETIGTPILPSPAAAGTYSFFLQLGSGTCVSERSEILVNITSNPTPSISTPTTIFCQGQPVILNSSLPFVNNWSTGQSGGSITVSQSGSYSVTAIDTLGCMGTSATINITMNSLPFVDAGPDQEACYLQDVTLTASGASNYTWNNSVTNNVPFNALSTKTYIVSTTDVNGCTSTDTVTITVHSPPEVSGGPDLDICAGDTVILSGSGATTYTWNGGVENGVPFVPTAWNIYAVHGIDDHGCFNNAFVEVNIFQPTIPTISLIEQTEPPYMVASPQSASNEYVWIDCSTNFEVPGAVNAVHIPWYVGSYAVLLTNQGGCSVTSDCVYIGVVGMEEKNSLENIALYPNPTQGNIYLEMSGSESVTITVHDVKGRLISSMGNAQDGTLINLSQTEAGMYIIKVGNTKGSHIFRIFKE